MTDISASAQDITLPAVEKMVTFLTENKLLTKACDESGLDYDAVKRNFKGDAAKIKIMYAVILINWVQAWHEHEAERRKLAEFVPEQLKA